MVFLLTSSRTEQAKLFLQFLLQFLSALLSLLPQLLHAPQQIYLILVYQFFTLLCLCVVEITFVEQELSKNV